MNPSATNPHAANPRATNPRAVTLSATSHGATDPSATSHSPASHEDLVETSLSNLREHRADAARWLAVEVLMADPDALADDELVDRLCRLQDRLETQTRRRYGVA